MSIIFGFLIFIALISTAVLFGLAMLGHWKNDSERKGLWQPVIILLAVTTILMMNRAFVTDEANLNSAYIGLWLLVSIAMFISMASSRFYKMKYKVKGKFKKISWTAFGIGFVFFLLAAVTLPDVDVEDDVEAVQENVEDKTEEVLDEPDETAEKAAEEEKREQAERKKAEEEQRLAEEKEVEEQLAKEKAAKEEKLAAEKKAAEEKKAVEEKEKLAAEKKAKKEAEKEASVKDGLEAVSLYRVVDGDTVHVLDSDNTTLKLRLLLIDTPETVHPNKPVEAFGPEASARMIELVSNADQLHIEYDTGDETDHYGRHLVYLYADGVNVHEVMLEEGLARVGYIYEQQRYLSEFKEKEQYAKDNLLGIWSIPGYVNEDGEGFNSGEKETTIEVVPDNSVNTDVNVGSRSTGGESYNFANCTELKTVFPDGVASDHSAYQPKMDRDKDNWACE